MKPDHCQEVFLPAYLAVWTFAISVAYEYIKTGPALIYFICSLYGFSKTTHSCLSNTFNFVSQLLSDYFRQQSALIDVLNIIFFRVDCFGDTNSTGPSTNELQKTIQWAPESLNVTVKLFSSVAKFWKWSFNWDDSSAALFKPCKRQWLWWSGSSGTE